jgi:Domain of unknown function (DUF4349)
MRNPARLSLLLGLVALGSACAPSKPGVSSDAPADAYYPPGYDVAAAEEALGHHAQDVMPMPPGAPASVPSTGAVMPAAVMGSIAPVKAASSEGEPAVADDELPTTGDDAIDQMIVFNGALTLAVPPATIPASIDAAVELAVAAGGYIAQQTDTSLTLRVPSRRFRKLMKGIEGLGQVRARSVQTLDVSEEFHDLKVRLENLQATRTRIQKLLGQAKDLGEILVVEKELERVSAEIDRIEGRLRFLSSQAAFSTVTLGLVELPRELTIVAEEPATLIAPPPPPARLLDPSVEWINEVDVHRLMSL